MISIIRCVLTHNNVYSSQLTKAEGWRHFALTLKSERTLMTFNYSITAQSGTPQLEEVIEHLEDLSDAVEAYPKSVELWAAEYGMDHNLPSTHKKYAWAQSIAKDFRHLQGGETPS